MHTQDVNRIQPPYLDVLAEIHRVYKPRSYVEVGVRNGGSFSHASCASIGIDPSFNITTELNAPVRLRRTTSDEYFSREDPREWLRGPIDLAFIDGMHLLEFALRDFINVERFCTWSSLIMFDDVLPRDNDEAARERHTDAWTGDVFRIREVLTKHRPDLTLTTLNTDPTGLLLVTGLDPRSVVLSDHFDNIVAEHVIPDPQVVPTPVVERAGTVEVSEMFESAYFDVVRPGRRRTPRRARKLRSVSVSLGSL